MVVANYSGAKGYLTKWFLDRLWNRYYVIY
jgi:hypothetical protein